MREDLYVPAGSTAGGPYTLDVTQQRAGWTYSALRVLELPAGGAHTFATGDEEMVVLPLAGSCTVECDRERFVLAGRDSVFCRVSDFCYLPRDASVTVTSAAGGRFALPAARCTRRLSARYGAA
ncbi:MAG: 5-deoxy-glucuronate isomerase, partial [Carbonactinosporaceae bacterium]